MNTPPEYDLTPVGPITYVEFMETHMCRLPEPGSRADDVFTHVANAFHACWKDFGYDRGATLWGAFL